jgi:Flp pilus assembly pilin Flp
MAPESTPPLQIGLRSTTFADQHEGEPKLDPLQSLRESPMSATFIQLFLKDEDGAVTVDWVVLTGAVVGLAFAVVLAIQAGATDTAGSIGARLSQAEITNIEF